MIRVTDVEYIQGYILDLTFNNGEVYRVDLIELTKKPAYSKLKSKEYFKQFGLVRGTLEWMDNLDVAPEFLYDLALSQSSKKSMKA
ncbi:MAG: DUF2442 domain-containing protein [Cyclobacteriaceae bacterium]